MTPSHRSGPRPSVVVLTYNSASTLEACLRAALPQADELGGEVIVVDNDSRDDTVEVAARCGVRLICSGANLGFAAGCNLGARSAEGDLLVLLNPDAVLDDGALSAMVDAAGEGERRGPFGGRAHDQDGAYDLRAVLGRPSLWGAICFAFAIDRLARGSARLDPEHGPRDLDVEVATHPVPAVSGALMAVPVELWGVLGGFDERYFLYGEDVDLCVRAARYGWSPTLVSAAGYHHVGGVSSGGNPHGKVLLYRGKVELYRRHLPAWQARLAVLALQAGVLLRGLPASWNNERMAEKAAPWRGLFRSRREWRRGYEGRPGALGAS